MSQLAEEINGEMSQLGGEMSQLGGRGDNEHNEQGISNKERLMKGDEMSQLGGEINGEMSQLSGEMSQLPERVRMVRDAKRVTEEYMESAITACW